MVKLAIIIGSVRPARLGESVAKWVYELAQKREDAEFELIDLLDQNLPMLDEPVPAAMRQYTKDHTKAWSAKISPFDGYIFVTPEYNHAPPASLKNAIDFLYHEWTNKVAGFVSYGADGGIRSVEQLRQVMATLKVADVREEVTLSLFADFENGNVFKPLPIREKSVETLIDQLVTWGGIMKSLRNK